MGKIETTSELLAVLGMPKKQQSELCALTLLALAGLRKRDKYQEATNNWVRIHDIIEFLGKNYKKNYAENSRETFRKQALHHFRTAAFIEDNGKATNSPNYRYRLTEEFLGVMQNIIEYRGHLSANLSLQAKHFIKQHVALKDLYSSKKKMREMPVQINQKAFTFGPGAHNQLQKAILEEFSKRFAPGSKCLYVGDALNKNLVNDIDTLTELGFEINVHNKMPDVVLYSPEQDWIYFIEAVDSVGPMDYERIRDIESMTTNVSAGKIFITAFLTFSKFKKFADALAWETEVWIAEMPDHMIHLNGDRFLGPR